MLSSFAWKWSKLPGILCFQFNSYLFFFLAFLVSGAKDFSIKYHMQVVAVIISNKSSQKNKAFFTLYTISLEKTQEIFNGVQ